jgi:hypothetical protein
MGGQHIGTYYSESFEKNYNMLARLLSSDILKLRRAVALKCDNFRQIFT